LLFNSRNQKVRKVVRHLDIVDERGCAKWLVHPVHGRNVDVVAIPLPEPDNEVDYRPINLMNVTNLTIAIGMDVFILGYPFGIQFPAYPVWKRGSIASEPEFAPLMGHFMLVDSASRPGMSGSPVIRRSWGNHLLEGGNLQIGVGQQSRLVGIYSGRLHANDPNDPQLARVWPVGLIDEILDASARDTE
jgi:hypothetical protein